MAPLGDVPYLTDPIFALAVYGVFILRTYLLYVLFHGIYKKRIHKKYGYSFLAFFPIFILFYFGYYIQYDRGEFISESVFEIKSQNIEVNEEDNGFLQLGKIFVDDSEYYKKILELETNHYSNSYNCIMLYSSEKCIKENLSKSLESNTINEIHNEISKAINHKYFKQEINNDYFNFQGLKSISKISLFTVINYLEEGQEDDAIKILLIYEKVGDKFLDGSQPVWSVISGWSIEFDSIKNIDYIIDNYEISYNNLNKLKEGVNNLYDSQEILSNAVKLEYWINKYILDRQIRSSSMILDKEELFNEQKKSRLSILNGEEYPAINKNYFKKSYLAKRKSWGSYISPQGFKEYIERVNVEKKKVLEKINLQLNK